MEQLPEEILLNIIEQTCDKPTDYLMMCGINDTFKKIIYSLDGIYKNKDKYYYDIEINDICKKQTSTITFDWLFRNNVSFSLENIKQLIIYNRTDVFHKGFFFQSFLKQLFNRFYINRDPYNDIFSFTETKNPLMVAGINNRIEIIKLLLDKSTIGNPYTNSIDGLLDIAIKYNHKNLLSYLIINHFSKIKGIIDHKLNSIIYRVNDCEDILFYLLVNKKINIYSKHLRGIISKHYNELFSHYYSLNCVEFGYTQKLQLLTDCVLYNNITIFNLIFEKVISEISNKEFTKILFENKRKSLKHDPEFIYNIINNHIDHIEKESAIINICIINDIEEDTIIKLINNDYSFTVNDMENMLKNGRYKLLEVACSKVNNGFNVP